jgi:nicotinate-nucleotide--dimethylbenzimidazole phosphoribosyltransferase
LIDLSDFPIEPASQAHWAQAQALLDRKTKPLGSLGRLEMLAAQLCAIQRQVPPETNRKRILLFAGDHGIVAERTSAYPQAVTAQMIANFAGGGAAINVLARQMNADLEVVDVGVATPVEGLALDRNIRAGTRNFAQESALTAEEALRAIAAGRERAAAAASSAVHILALGEMGIGNTASASALLSLLTGTEAEMTGGRGAGLDVRQVLMNRSEYVYGDHATRSFLMRRPSRSVPRSCHPPCSPPSNDAPRRPHPGGTLCRPGYAMSPPRSAR